MNIFTDKSIKIFFIRIVCILGGFTFLSQFFLWFFYGGCNFVVLLLFLVATVSILGTCFLYFHKQNALIEEAISKINLYLSGNRDLRIDCDDEGSIYKLFHAVNTLATALNAHIIKEKKLKIFLKSTISDISHQLKTPLSALTIYNELMQEELEDTKIIKELVIKSEKEMERIEILVQNLLKITKLDAGAIVLKKKPENIANIIEEIYQHFEVRAKIEEKTIIMSGPDAAFLYCDRDWVMEAISNVVKNALDHTKPGSQIIVGWKKLPEVIQITVKDNGCGIHPEDVHHIFKRFYRSRFSKDTQGIGLGLPLAKTIVEAHDGNITVDSVLGKGSMFIFNFIDMTKM